MGTSTHTGGASNILGMSKHRRTSRHMGASNIQGMHPNIWGIQTYLECLNICGTSKHRGGLPNIWGTFKHMEASKHTGGHPNIWGHPNKQWVHPHIWGYPSIQGAMQTYEGIQNNGVYKCMGASGHPLSLTKHAFFVLYMYSRHPNIIQTYREHPNIWVCPNIWGISKHTRGIQTCGGVQTYRGHPNIQEGIQTYGGHPNVLGHMDTP